MEGQKVLATGENIGQALAGSVIEKLWEHEEEEIKKWLAKGYKVSDLVLEVSQCSIESHTEGLIVRQPFLVRLKTDAEIDQEVMKLDDYHKMRRRLARGLIADMLATSEYRSLTSFASTNKTTLEYLLTLLEEMDAEAQTQSMDKEQRVRIEITRGGSDTVQGSGAKSY